MKLSTPNFLALVAGANQFVKRKQYRMMSSISKWFYLFMPMNSVFSKIYSEKRWSKCGSASGLGSSLEQTVSIRQRVPQLLMELGTRVILDAACGDFFWMRRVDLGLIQYIGADIVSELISRNQNQHGRENRKFIVLDIVHDVLPQVDLILCRDALVHLSHAKIARAIRNFKASGSTYLLTTTFPGVKKNKRIFSGKWRPLNLEIKPFCFPRPLELIQENGALPDSRFLDKCLGLWLLRDL